jgi:ribosomal protein L37AE/L43A
LKGFKKDGKFRPTEKRNKSALSKSDIGRQELQTKKYVPIEQRKKQNMDDLECPECHSSKIHKNKDKGDSRFGQGDYACNNCGKTFNGSKVRHKEIIGDDASETGRLEDIFGDVTKEDGKIDHDKLTKEARSNIEYILNREKIIKKGDTIYSDVTDWQEEGEHEDGDSGYYLARFYVLRNNQKIFDGLAEGDIMQGSMWDMELQVKKY